MSIVHQWQKTWRPEAPAIQFLEEAVDYRELERRVLRAAAWIRGVGLQPGDVLALQMEKSLTFLELHLGALALGITTLPLNPAYTQEELAFLLKDSAARCSVLIEATEPGSQTAEEVLRQLEDTIPLDSWPPAVPLEQLGVLCYTSGTTGRPKGAMLTQRAIAATVDALVEAWEWTPDDRLVHALPLFHIHGLFVAQHAALRVGASALWLPRFDPAEAIETIESGAATIFMGVPAFYNRFLASGLLRPFPAMRLFTSGSAPLPAAVHQAFRDATGISILERYGMTEVGIVLSNPLHGERRAGSVGLPLPGVEAKITRADGTLVPRGSEIGEVRIRSGSLCSGYLNRPDATREALGDGWMHTGDLGSQSEDGYITLAGRSNDLILRGGMNVYPPEVEAEILKHPKVTEVSVVGVPHPDLGEGVAAAYVGTATSEELALHCERMAQFKRPSTWLSVDSLPRNSMGKVMKRTLRERLAKPRVREARLADASYIAHSNQRMAQETENLTLAHECVSAGVRAVLNDTSKGRYWIAEIAGRPVGVSLVTREWSDWRARWVWWLGDVFVEPALRGQGIFRTLYAAIREEARVSEAAGLRLYVDKSNASASAVYAKLGMDGDHYRVFEDLF